MVGNWSARVATCCPSPFTAKVGFQCVSDAVGPGPIIYRRSTQFAASDLQLCATLAEQNFQGEANGDERMPGNMKA